MYAQICTRPDMTYMVEILSRYQSNLDLDYRKTTKKAISYLQRIKHYILTYRYTDHLEVVGYLDLDFGGCIDTKKSTSEYIFFLAGGAVS